MKNNNPYTHLDTFCLRTPLLPLAYYFDLTKTLHTKENSYEEIWKNDIIKEAVFLSSPELYNEIDKCFKKNIKDVEKLRRLKFSLLKYISRMSSRCTPFGLFAGCSVGSFASETKIELLPYRQNKRQTRFDMNFLIAFASKLSKEKEIKNQLLWYPNTSLYRIGEQYRYVEYVYNKNNRREHSIEAIAYSPYIKTILEQAKSGKKIEELASLLVDDDITIEEANLFVGELISHQVLVSELEPSVTGEDFLYQMSRVLQRINDTSRHIETIHSFQNTLNTFDTKIGNKVEDYLSFSNAISDTGISFDLKYLFQTDMYMQNISNTLSVKWAYKIKRLMLLFNKLTYVDKSDSTMSRFKKSFLKRYETREMPLTLVLDTENGIGYDQNQDAEDSTPFLDGIEIPVIPSEEIKYARTAITDVLAKKLSNTRQQKLRILELEDKDFESFSAHWEDLPDTLSCMIEIVHIDGQEMIYVPSIGGTSAANLLGRFSTGSESIEKHVREITSIEQKMNKDKILAEIVHLPESRTGNVIRRADIRSYEIPYLGKSNKKQNYQIGVNDLMISVRGNRIILRSKKHNKEVLPRLTNAHNYNYGSLPIYHFLCDLQKQDTRSSIGFGWHAIFETEKYLPRVVYKGFILSKARWNFTSHDITSLTENIESNEYIDKIRYWRSSWDMPQYIQLVQSDNTLLVNLENKDSIMMLSSLIKNEARVVLEEFFFGNKNVVKQENKGYTNQFVLSFYNQKKLDRSKENKDIL